MKAWVTVGYDVLGDEIERQVKFTATWESLDREVGVSQGAWLIEDSVWVDDGSDVPDIIFETHEEEWACMAADAAREATGE